MGTKGLARNNNRNIGGSSSSIIIFNNNNTHSVRCRDELSDNHQVARTNELLRMNESGVGGQPPFLMNLDDAATDVLLHFFLPGGQDYLISSSFVWPELLTLVADSTVGSNSQGLRHMQLTATDIQPVQSPNLSSSVDVSLTLFQSRSTLSFRTIRPKFPFALTVFFVAFSLSGLRIDPSFQGRNASYTSTALQCFTLPRPCSSSMALASVGVFVFFKCSLLFLIDVSGFGDHAQFRLCLPWEAARNRARNYPERVNRISACCVVI